jgi:hypothetical protein
VTSEPRGLPRSEGRDAHRVAPVWLLRAERHDSWREVVLARLHGLHGRPAAEAEAPDARMCLRLVRAQADRVPGEGEGDQAPLCAEERGVNSTPRLYLPIDFAPEARLRGPAQPRCVAEGCNRTTSEGKPVCSHHWMLMPYAAAVHALAAPEPEGAAYTLTCKDCESPFRTRSKKAKRCPQCKKADVNKRAAEARKKREGVAPRQPRQSKPPAASACVVCREPLVDRSGGAIYCSNKCKCSARRTRWNKRAEETWGQAS